MKPIEQIVITANDRLQRHLVSTSLGGLLPRTASVTPAANIVSLERWFNDIWLTLQDKAYPGTDKRLLNDHEEYFLWLQILNNPDFEQHLELHGIALGSLINKKQMIEQLMQARSLMAHWQLNDNDLNEFNNIETKFLASSLDYLTRSLNQCNGLLKDDAIQIVGDAIQNNGINKPASIRLHGFVELSPLWQQNLSALSTDIQLKQYIQPSNATAPITQYSSLQQEIEHAAQWCQSLLGELEPNEQIAIIVPNLATIHTEIEQGFNRVFDPGFITNLDAEFANVPYDISLSHMLSDEPIIHAIFELANFAENRLELELVQKLNLCRYWGLGRSEARHRVSQQLAQRLSFDVSNADYIDLLSSVETAIARENNEHPFDHDRVSTFRKDTRQRYQSFDLKDGKKVMCSLLENLGWPGHVTLNSREYQAVQNFMALLDKLAGYASLSAHSKQTRSNGRIRFNAFMSLLKDLASKTSFHVQLPPRPIQVLGLMEGAGMQFAHCRMIAMTAANFPAPPQPNALIPYHLQDKVKTPRSTPERELEYAESLLCAYQECNPALEYSFHLYDTQDQPQELSPIIPQHNAQLTPIEPDHLSNLIDAYVTNAANAATHYETIDVTYTTPYPLNSVIDGGSYHLQLHIANPYYAFATYRLGIPKNVEPQFGFPAFIKGTLIHQLLALFWEDCQNSDNLAAKSNDDVQTFLKRHCDDIIHQHIYRHRLSISGDYLEAYKTQICLLVNNAIQMDRERGAFCVLAIESDATAEFLGYQYRLKLDRIDKIGDETFVIDYKTGSSNLANIQKQLLSEPQLPLYACIDTTNPHAAIGYCEIRPNQCRYLGIGELATPVHGIHPPATLNRYELPADWTQTYTWWTSILEHYTHTLATGYSVNIERNPVIVNYYTHLAPSTRFVGQSATEPSE